MAKAIEGSLMAALRGQIGKQLVVRQTRHGAVVSTMPRRSRAKRTAGQKAQQEKFRRAALYAKGAQALPEYVAAAKKRGTTAFNVATGDFLRPPEIKRIQLAKYNRKAGGVIEVVAVDDVLVTAVAITVEAGGAVIEQGQATRSSLHKALWVYTATQDAPPLPVKVTVTASDLAGNVTSGEEAKMS